MSTPHHPQPRRSSASACGKVIIVGEHAAVYGAPAIALPLKDARMEGVFAPCQDPRAETQLFLGDNPAPAGMLPLLARAFSLLEVEPFPVIIRGNSRIRAGAGLGSSAALCVVLLRLISQSVGRDLSPEQEASLGNELEKHFHGTPSGLDTAVVAFERVMAFQKREPLQPNRFSPLVVRPPAGSAAGSWDFALVDSLAHSPTLAMIERVRPFFQGAAGEGCLGRFADLAEQVEAGFAQGGVDQVAHAINAAAALLGQCGIITPTMHHIIDVAHKIGAIAAKPTGAGGGGNILVLFEPLRMKEQLERLSQVLVAHPVVPLILEPDRGV